MSLPHHEPCSSPLRATIIAIPIRSLPADSAQQSKCEEHKYDEQDGADNEASVITVNAVLSNVIVSGVEMSESVVSSNIRNSVNLLRHRVADVEHRLPNSVYRHLHLGNVWFDYVLNFGLDFLHFLLARVNRLLQASLQQSLDVPDDVFLIRKLKFFV